MHRSNARKPRSHYETKRIYRSNSKKQKENKKQHNHNQSHSNSSNHRIGSQNQPFQPKDQKIRKHSKEKHIYREKTKHKSKEREGLPFGSAAPSLARWMRTNKWRESEGTTRKRALLSNSHGWPCVSCLSWNIITKTVPQNKALAKDETRGSRKLIDES